MPAASYLVFGGCGLLGRQIARKLADRGDSVVVADIAQRYDDIPFRYCDITDEKAVLAAIQDVSPDCVFNTAVAEGAGISDDDFHYKVNLQGTKAIIAACQSAAVKRLVYSSSSGVVFNGKDLKNVDEGYPVNYSGYNGLPYYRSKALAEKAVLDANGTSGLLTCVLRPTTIFGVGDCLAVPKMYQQYQQGKTGIQIGNNDNIMDWCSVRNLADAHILAADGLISPLHPDEPVAGQVFFISNDDPWPFWDFPNAVYSRLDKHYPGKRDKNKKPFIIPRWLGYALATILEIQGWLVGRKPPLTRLVVTFATTYRYHNVSKAKRVLGYAPKISMNEELDAMVEWYVKKVQAEENEAKKTA